MAIAYSYIRFSTPEQAKGDSLRRQTDLANKWCEANNITLDTTLTLHDLGRSAFLGNHRQNPDRHALAAFLKMVEEGRIPKGSYLLVENLDRLSREHIVPALTLLLNLIDAGIRVVQLSPTAVVFDDETLKDPMPLMMAIMELSRGHGESRIKSERVGKAWEQKRVRMRRDGEILTNKLPAWIERVDDKLVVKVNAKLYICRIFALAAHGFGAARIVKTLTNEKAVPFTGAGHWSRSYVNLLLNDERVLGKFQARKRDGSADGEAIDYFPAVITEEEWLKARSTRREVNTAGRVSERVALLSGLMVRAGEEGDRFYQATRTEMRGGKKVRNFVYLNVWGAEGRATTASFPCEIVEDAVLNMVISIDPDTLVGKNEDASKLQMLMERRAQLQAFLKTYEEKLMNALPLSDLENKAVVKNENELNELNADIGALRVKMATPAAEAFHEARSLADATVELARQGVSRQELRQRLKTALRRLVACIHAHFQADGRRRLAMLQVHFKELDNTERIVISYDPPKSNGRAVVQAVVQSGSVLRTGESVYLLDATDLRNPQHVEALQLVFPKLLPLLLPTTCTSLGQFCWDVIH